MPKSSIATLMPQRRSDCRLCVDALATHHGRRLGQLDLQHLRRDAFAVDHLEKAAQEIRMRELMRRDVDGDADRLPRLRQPVAGPAGVAQDAQPEIEDQSALFRRPG